MSYQELAQLIENNKEEVAYRTAEEAISRNLSSYLNFTIEQLAQNFLPTVEMLSRYVLNGNPEEYRNYIMRLTEIRLAQGYSVEDFYVMGEVLTKALQAFVDAKLPEQEYDRARRRYHLRLSGIQTLAQSTVVATRYARMSKV